MNCLVHPATVGRAQDSKSSPVKDRRSTIALRNQPTNWSKIKVSHKTRIQTERKRKI